MKWIVVLIAIICIVGYANTLSVERTVKVTIDTGLSWESVEGDNYALVTDDTSFFALTSPSSLPTADSGILSLEQNNKDFVFIISSDSQKLVDKMPELELQGFFSSAINFVTTPTNTELVFYINNLVADISQYNKIDILIHKDGDDIVMEDALK